MAKTIKTAIVSNNGPKRARRAKASAVSVATVKAVTEPTKAQIKAWWPNIRGKLILEMMEEGLSYFRAVKRSRRYFLEGKY